MLVGIAGTAFLAVSFAQTALSSSSAAGPSGSSLNLTATQSILSGAKRDRIAKPVAADERAVVTIVELVGLSQTIVVLKDQSGNVVYRSDPQANTTYFSKNTDLPVVTIREEAKSPVVQQPVERRQEQENASETPKRKTSPVGCFGALSPLVKSEASRTPSLCLAALEQNPRS